MQPSLKLTVGGSDLSTSLEQSSWRITHQLGRAGKTFSFTLVAEQALSLPDLAVTTFVDQGSAGTANLFGGVLTNVQTLVPSPNLWKYQCTANDFSYYTDRRIVWGTYSKMTIGAIVASLLASFPCAVTGNHVQTGPVIDFVQFVYCSLSNALDRLCALASGGKENWTWYVDGNRDLWVFNQAAAELCAWYLTDDVTDTNPAAVHYVRDGSGSAFSVTRDLSQLRTRVYLRGGSVTSPVWTDQWLADGKAVAWPLTYTPDTSAYPPVLTVNNVAQTVAVDDGSGMQTQQFLLTRSGAGQWLLIVNPALWARAKDSFNRADNATSLGSADTGQTWAVLNGGPWGIVSKQAYQPGNVAGSVAVVDATVSDGVVQVSLSTMGTGAGLVFRASDASNFWKLYASGSTYVLAKRVAGADTTVATISVAPSSGDLLSVALSGPAITVAINGVQRAVASDSFNQTATKHGLHASDNVARFDDFSVLLRNPVASGYPIVLQYEWDMPMTMICQDLAAQAAYGSAVTGHDGRFDIAIQDTKLVTLQSALARGQQELVGYAWGEERVHVETTAEATQYDLPGLGSDTVTPIDIHAGHIIRVTNAQMGWTGQPFLIYACDVEGVAGGYHVWRLDLVAVNI